MAGLFLAGHRRDSDLQRRRGTGMAWLIGQAAATSPRLCDISAWFVANILFRSPAAFASENNEVRFGFSDFMSRHHHDSVASKASAILTGVQRIEQEFLVVRHGRFLFLIPKPNDQSRQPIDLNPGNADFAPESS
jgi:hypothetical protein